MARKLRVTPANYVYHVYNRGSRKGQLFYESDDYIQFECVLSEARDKHPMRILAYCLMPTHFHLLVRPYGDDDLPVFMQWLTATHARRWHWRRGSVGTGAVYQSRYGMVPAHDSRHYFSVLRYVERNALAAGLVTAAQDWPWGSATARVDPAPFRLDEGPFLRPENWQEVLNLP